MDNTKNDHHHQGCGFFFDCVPCGAKGNIINYRNQRILESTNTDGVQEKEELDRYLESSMKALSVEDRTAALEEFHGVAASSVDQENSLLLKERLEEIELQLTKMNTEGTAYGAALKQNADYVKNSNFRLMFLRSNRYNSKPAAEQIVKFFETKRALFGVEKLTRDILFQDLNADDKKCLEEGSVQILPAKDSINRTILLFLGGLRSKVPVESEARAYFYLLMRRIMNSEDVQRKGLIVVVYMVDEYQDSKKGAGAQYNARVATSMPIPFAGIHMCCGYNDFGAFVIVQAIIMMLPKYLAAKFRVHFGSHIEVQYALRSFGIPDLALSANNAASLLGDHKSWILQSAYEDSLLHPSVFQTNQRSLTTRHETLSSRELMVGRPDQSVCQVARVTPLDTDVLLGHGFNRNPGNLKLHDMIDSIVNHYHSTERKSDKISISSKIVADCKASGSRFLSYDGKTRKWSIVSDKVARNKVAKAIRNRPRSVKGKVLLSR